MKLENKDQYNHKAQRKIIHIDMDCFYAAVEMRDNPKLKTRPIAIGGDSKKRGVLCTCNYIARQYGVKSAMPTAYALRLCPELLVLPGRMEVYKGISKQLHNIFSRYTDLIEPLSLDEAYLDVSHSTLFSGSATLIAQDIRRSIKQELNLTASAGVAPNKYLAKIASDEKKPDGLFVLSPKQVPEFLPSLSLRKLPGIGRVSEKKLAKYGLHTANDVLPWSEQALCQLFGKQGRVLYWRSRGVDNRELEVSRKRKSIGVELTLERDINDFEQCQALLKMLLPKLVRRINNNGNTLVNRVAVKLKFSDFNQTTAEKKLVDGFSDDLFAHLTLNKQLTPPIGAESSQEALLEEQLQPLLKTSFSRALGRSIRLLGLQVGLACELSENNNEQQLTLDLL